MTTWRDAEKYLSSLWLLDRDDDRPLDFHGAFVPAVAEGLILRHTQPGDWVWDPMAGSGTTGYIAERLGRRCVMSDLTPRSPNIYPADARTTKLVEIEGSIVPWHIVDEWQEHSPEPEPFQFDLVILHPPYHDIIQFSDKPEDLSNCKDVNRFLMQLYVVAFNISEYLKPGGYVGLVIGDIWIRGEARVEPLGFEAMQAVLEGLGDGARLKAIAVKDIKNNNHRAGQKNLWSARYFKWGAVHFTHEYVFSIQKGK